MVLILLKALRDWGVFLWNGMMWVEEITAEARGRGVFLCVTAPLRFKKNSGEQRYRLVWRHYRKRRDEPETYFGYPVTTDNAHTSPRFILVDYRNPENYGTKFPNCFTFAPIK
jgi:hypothetical protein